MKSVLSIVTAVALLATASASASAATSSSGSSQCPQAALVTQAAPRHPDRPRPDAVLACVGPRPITGAQFAHWAPIFAANEPRLEPTDVVEEAMRLLVDFERVKGEARDRDVVVTTRDVRRLIDRRFRRAGSRERYLRTHKLSAVELWIFARHTLRTRALRRVGVHTASERFEQRWKERTTCALAYADGIPCGLIAGDVAGPPASESARTPATP